MHVRVAVELFAVQGIKKLAGMNERAKSCHGIKVCQRHDKFRFVVIVFIAALRRIHRDALRVFPRKPLQRLLLGRVRLQGQRLIGRKDLQQKGQLIIKFRCHVLPQCRLRVGGDDRIERFIFYRCGPTRVRAVPQFRDGIVGGGFALQVRNECLRTPRIGSGGTVEQLH